MTDDYVARIEELRRRKDEAFRREPWSPIEDRTAFRGLAYYPVEPGMRFRVRMERHVDPKTITLQTSDGAAREYRNVGHVDLPIAEERVRIQLYQKVGAASLFVPFRDKTSGKETYGAGRYLDLHLEPADQVDVDLNLAYHPYCAYNEAYSCPFPPPENWLQVPIRAGERSEETG